MEDPCEQGRDNNHRMHSQLTASVPLLHAVNQQQHMPSNSQIAKIAEQ